MKRGILLAVIVLLISVGISGCNRNEGVSDVDEVRFSEVDLLSKEWEQAEFPIEPREYFAQFTGQTISSKEDAVGVADAILENEQRAGHFPDFKLTLIEHDPNENIWVFTYGADWRSHYAETGEILLSSNVLVAMSGENSEVIAMWSLGG